MSAVADTYTPRLKEEYENEIRPRLKEELGLDSIMQAPRIEKITLNMGVGEAKTESKLLDSAVEELTTIAGQRAQVRRARKSIAQFKLREGMAVGARVTLRGDRMYEFLDRLVSIALPRIRDFRGLSPRSFDGRGNFSLGIREQLIFPEINYDEALHEHAAMPSSRMKVEIARLLREEGYIRDYHVEKGESFDTLVVDLKFGRNRERVISGLKRVSKPGRRVYARKDRLPRVLGGMGVAILSTSSGLVTSRTAQERGIGGEVVAFIW